MSKQHYSHQGKATIHRNPHWFFSWFPVHVQPTLLSPGEKQQFMETLAGFTPGSLFYFMLFVGFPNTNCPQQSNWFLSACECK